MVSKLASQIPKYLTLPCSTRRDIAPNVSSIGTLGSTRCWKYKSITSVFRRFRLFSHASITYSGRPSTGVCGLIIPKFPNLVARITLSLFPASAFANNSSLSPLPYASELSRKVHPASID